jgi:hypothetical protein
MSRSPPYETQTKLPHLPQMGEFHMTAAEGEAVMPAVKIIITYVLRIGWVGSKCFFSLDFLPIFLYYVVDRHMFGNPEAESKPACLSSPTH